MSRLQRVSDTWWPREVPRPQALLDFTRDLGKRHVFGAFTWNPGACGANTTTDTTLTTATSDAFEDLRAGMAVFITPPSTLNTGLVVGGAWCATDSQLTIRIGNLTAGSINPAEATWIFFAFQL